MRQDYARGEPAEEESGPTEDGDIAHMRAANHVDVDVDIKPLGDAPRAHRSRGGGGSSSAVSVGSEGGAQRRRRRRTGPPSQSSMDSKDSSQSLPVGARRGNLKTEGSVPKDPSLRVVFKGEQVFHPEPRRKERNGSSEARRAPSDEDVTQAWLAQQQAAERQREGAASAGGPAPITMSRTVRSPTSTAVAELSQEGVAGPAKPASDLRSAETGSERSDAGYSLDGFVVGDQVVPNPLQGAVGQAPEGWADVSPGTPAKPGASKVADDGFPQWFHQYQAWLKPPDGKFTPLLLLLSWHGCACGCCGCCGCICGHSLGESPPVVEGVAQASEG